MIFDPRVGGATVDGEAGEGLLELGPAGAEAVVELQLEVSESRLRRLPRLRPELRELGPRAGIASFDLLLVHAARLLDDHNHGLLDALNLPAQPPLQVLKLAARDAGAARPLASGHVGELGAGAAPQLRAGTRRQRTRATSRGILTTPWRRCAAPGIGAAAAGAALEASGAEPGRLVFGAGAEAPEARGQPSGHRERVPRGRARR
mmetsp:Transcript_35345/g.100426  ORF Transcript_35345/g.100426 Transcript_35345/m.100426 type:complete len:205 (+) Transcript_35345:837-1451(+)